MIREEEGEEELQGTRKRRYELMKKRSKRG